MVGQQNDARQNRKAGLTTHNKIETEGTETQGEETGNETHGLQTPDKRHKPKKKTKRTKRNCQADVARLGEKTVG